MAYKIIEVIGTSQKSFSDAAKNALLEAEKTLHGIESVDVVHSRARINHDKIVEYDVTVKITFKIER
jgi:flavin-binding protein dodecin